jgi:hypothetical protein
MITIPDAPTPLPTPASISPPPGGITFREAAPMLATVVDNGVCPDDPRVKTRLNEATKMVLDSMVPVGGMCRANVAAVNGMLILPPEMENIYEAVPSDTAKVFGDSDITQGWYDIVNQSMYLDTTSAYDNPLIDAGLWSDPAQPQVLRRAYVYPGLEPPNSIVSVTGAKRFIPVTKDSDFLIVQNIEALKMLILSIERNENSAPDEAVKYKQQAMELLQAEVKKHILDPRNYMRRKGEYASDAVNFPENSLGWLRASLALDIDEALRLEKHQLTWVIMQSERRFMQRAIYKDTITQLQAVVTGGIVYFPIDVGCVLAINLNGHPIPIRGQFFQSLENGPGMFPQHPMLIDQGDEVIASGSTPRRKYKLIAHCTEGQCINAVCKLRWRYKKPGEMMVIKNYEAMRLMVSATLRERKDDWQNAQAGQQQAFDILDKELQSYLSGIKHTPQIQTYGFGLGERGCDYSVR